MIFDGQARGCCVEVGASSGVELSNTYYFEQIGWQILLIEPAGTLNTGDAGGELTHLEEVWV